MQNVFHLGKFHMQISAFSTCYSQWLVEFRLFVSILDRAQCLCHTFSTVQYVTGVRVACVAIVN